MKTKGIEHWAEPFKCGLRLRGACAPAGSRNVEGGIKAWGNNEKGATRRLRTGLWALINRESIRMLYDSNLQP
jgi:hypothetical protein